MCVYIHIRDGGGDICIIVCIYCEREVQRFRAKERERERAPIGYRRIDWATIRGESGVMVGNGTRRNVRRSCGSIDSLA